ncbi:predicted protein [Histoplasma capsulatum var. duboisii H88]|uniref:Predicted protein n=1 Tax=Ajellomyces capsulatus (strain H88) TaxID=544711 RepID=F0U6K2_AJEC8|nr:predicted protein [Histoplasma capsulatum var. duboisii H88]
MSPAFNSLETDGLGMRFPGYNGKSIQKKKIKVIVKMDVTQKEMKHSRKAVKNNRSYFPISLLPYQWKVEDALKISKNPQQVSIFIDKLVSGRMDVIKVPLSRSGR